MHPPRVSRYAVIIALYGLLMLLLPAVAGAQAQDPPLASFTLEPELGTVPHTVRFTDTSQGAETWSWDFGDGATSGDQHPQHMYVRPGRFTIELEVCNPAGCDSASAGVSVEGLDALDGGQIFDGGTVYGAINDVTDVDRWSFEAEEGDVVTIVADAAAGSFLETAVRLFGPDGEVVAASEPFGFDFTSLAEISDLRLPASGTYAIETSGRFGTTGAYELTLTLRSTTAVSASFDPASDIGVAPAVIAFQNHSRNATSYHWDFGDGGTSESINPVHRYDAGGVYEIGLTACRGEECGEATQTVVIEASDGGSLPDGVPVTGRLDYEQDVDLWTFYASHGTEVTIELVAVDEAFDPRMFLIGPGDRVFAFDDDSGVGLNSLIDAFTIPFAGTYAIEVGAFSAPEPADYELLLRIDREPIVQASVDVFALGFTAPAEVFFTDTSRGSPTSHRWDFGDGSSGTGGSVSHRYEEPGRFVVRLETCNIRSCGEWTVLLRIAAEDDGGAIALNQTAFGAINGPGDVDEWLLEGTAGLVVTIGVRADDFSFFDPVLELLGPDGALVALDDDSGGALQPLLADVILPADGTYTIRVRGFNDALDIGAYRIEVSG